MRNVVNVGIMAEKKLEMTFHGDFLLDGETVTGKVELEARHFKGEMLFTPVSEGAYTEVRDVMIGVNFHWQRREVQCFEGAIKVVKDNDLLVLINIIDIEEYLKSVISSEMSATSSLELLKAHAVISRSWVLAQIENHQPGKQCVFEETVSDSKLPIRREIRWYGHDDHTLFDICADDHCQRYQGITRANTPQVVEAIEATRGEVMRSEGQLVDARFSKCCGGVFEEFETCWEDDHKPYLIARRDNEHPLVFPDLRNESESEKWILGDPDAYCNTHDKEILSQVLNNYDQETADFYRWTVEYDAETLSELVKRRSGIDFGRIIDMIPLKRGTSGRLIELRIVGEKCTVEVGKELEIRRWLSESHLYSSAFVVEKEYGEDERPVKFILRGAGWGHGVGLCQIGAAVMAAKGMGYRDILLHYYPGVDITK